jgi:hypothetical protein
MPLIHPLLDRPEWVLDRLTALVKDGGMPRDPSLHPVQNGFVLKTRHEAETVLLCIASGLGNNETRLEAMVRHFIHGVLTDNLDETAEATFFLLTVCGTEKIPDKAAMSKNWAKIFDCNFIEHLKNDVPHEMPVYDYGAALGNEAWFNSKGAADICP